MTCAFGIKSKIESVKFCFSHKGSIFKEPFSCLWCRSLSLSLSLVVIVCLSFGLFVMLIQPLPDWRQNAGHKNRQFSAEKNRLRGPYLTLDKLTVWPGVDIKSIPIFQKMPQKLSQLFLLKKVFSKISLNVTKYLGHFYHKVCYQKLSQSDRNVSLQDLDCWPNGNSNQRRSVLGDFLNDHIR